MPVSPAAPSATPTYSLTDLKTNSIEYRQTQSDQPVQSRAGFTAYSKKSDIMPEGRGMVLDVSRDGDTVEISKTGMNMIQKETQKSGVITDLSRYTLDELRQMVMKGTVSRTQLEAELKRRTTNQV